MIVTSAASDALMRLRQRMRPHHDRIEASLNLMGPGVDRATYQRFLERSYGFVSVCERMIDVDCAPAALSVERRLKTCALISDLKALGHSDASIRALPLADRLPDVAAWPSALGYFYVMEGSTLGGQVLSRHFKRALNMADEGLTFLTSYGPATGSMWKQMLAVLEEGLADAGDESAIADTAGATFELLADWHAR